MAIIMGSENVLPVCDLILLTVFQHLIPKRSILECATFLVFKQIFFRFNLIFLFIHLHQLV